MRIICLIESLGSGGAERQMTGLACMLSSSGYQVRVLTYYPNDFWAGILESNGVEFKYLSRANNKLRRIPVLHSEIKKYGPEAIIAYLPTAALVACVIKLTGLKYKLIVSERNTSQNNNLRERIRFFFYRWADYIVPNSHSQSKFIACHYPSLMPKVKVITNFVDTDRFVPESKETSDTCQIICVGRLDPQKNVICFLESLDILKSKGVKFHVDWYGNQEGDYGDMCKLTMEEMNLSNEVSFIKPVKNLERLYPKYDVFCLPSIYEGFPNVVCEAMSCGLPILCGNVCDNSFIVNDGKNGFLFNPFDITSIANQIGNFIKLPEYEKDTIRKENRSRAVAMFSKGKFIDSYRTLIEN